MPEIENPPALTGHILSDIKAMWSYLYRLAETLRLILNNEGG